MTATYAQGGCLRREQLLQRLLLVLLGLIGYYYYPNPNPSPSQQMHLNFALPDWSSIPTYLFHKQTWFNYIHLQNTTQHTQIHSQNGKNELYRNCQKQSKALNKQLTWLWFSFEKKTCKKLSKISKFPRHLGTTYSAHASDDNNWTIFL